MEKEIDYCELKGETCLRIIEPSTNKKKAISGYQTIAHSVAWSQRSLLKVEEQGEAAKEYVKAGTGLSACGGCAAQTVCAIKKATGTDYTISQNLWKRGKLAVKGK